MFTRACTCSVPSSDADVDVVSLGEDPRVAAWDNAEFENHAASVARGIDVRVGDVSLERDAVDDVPAKVERPRRSAVCPVGGHDQAGVHGRRIAFDAVAKLGTSLDRALDEEVVEAAPLGHQRQVAAPAHERAAVVEAALDAADDVLDDRVDREGELLDRAELDPAATRLVARKAGLVEEQDVGACLCKPVCSRRPSRPRADDCDVEPLHQPKATMRRPGGVPERPKGTGCKPVGSAYGGSNPPAPTPSRSPRGCAEHGDFATFAVRSGWWRDASLRER